MAKHKVSRDQADSLARLVDAASAGDFPQMERILRDAGYVRGRFAQTQADVAEFWGVSVRTIREWLGQCPPRTPNGYDLSAIARWRNEYLLSQINRPLASADADTELKRVKTARERLKLARERREVVAIDHVERVWRRYFAAARAVILGIPERINVQLPDRLRPELRPTIRQAMDEVLGMLADVVHDIDDEPKVNGEEEDEEEGT